MAPAFSSLSGISSLLVGTLLLSGSALSLAQEDVPSFVPTSDSSAEAKQKLAGNILVKFKTKGGIAASAANAALSTILSAAGLEEIDAGMFPSTGLSLLRMEFLAFDLEQGYDFVTHVNSAGNQLGRFSGAATPANIQIPASTYERMIFTTDFSVVRAGFKVKCHIRAPCPGGPPTPTPTPTTMPTPTTAPPTPTPRLTHSSSSSCPSRCSSSSSVSTSWLA